MSEKTASIVESEIVVIRRNFCALRLLLKDSPPPPKTGERPVPGACKRIAVTKSAAIMICKIVITISPIIYVL